MRIHVLGSAAGGGLPQWNCNCANCHGARWGEPWISPRTQSSIAVSPDGRRWALINASPDVRTQLADSPHFRTDGTGPRSTRIAGVVLADAQIDHATGLLVLREGNRLPVHATTRVHDDLSTMFPLEPMLEHYCGVDRHEIPLDGTSFGIDGLAGIEMTAVPLQSRPPPYSSHRSDPQAGDNVGLVIRDTKTERSAFYAPGLGVADESLEARMADADCLLVDGSFWTDDELIQTGTGRKSATEMGHLPLSGEGGMLDILDRLDGPVKYVIHINNTNPILDERSPEREMVEAAGITVCRDRMDIEV